MHIRNCLVCDKRLYSAKNKIYEDGSFLDPIDDGIYFSSAGNYGSAVFDGGEFTGERLEIYVCDECLKEKSDKIYHVRKSKVEQGEYIVSKFHDYL